MSDLQPDRGDLFDRIHDLVTAQINGELTPEQFAGLDALLAYSAAARRVYVQYIYETLSLPLLTQKQEEGASGDPFLRAGELLGFVGRAIPPEPVAAGIGSAHSQLSSAPIPLGLFGSAWQGAVGFFSQEIPFAILVTTFIMGVAGVIGWHIPKEHYTQMPGRSVASADRSFSIPESDGAGKALAAVKEQKEVMQLVGRITGMVDCRWADPGRTFSGSTDYLVALHDDYSLTSGLMEITYNTGAKVILQGPVIYEVESVNGGYMSFGKLTGKVEVEKAKGFVVRTPTAVVTDLGTEFGVEVDDRQMTQMTVFQGEVELSRNANGASNTSLGRFKSGESASIDAAGAVRKEPVEANVFVRQEGLVKARMESVRRRQQSRLEQFRKDPMLAAYYAFDEENEHKSPERLLNRAAATAGRLDGILGEDGKPDTKPTWTDGHRPGHRALRFVAAKNQSVRVTHDDALNVGPSLTVVAWVKYHIPMPPRGCVILSRREPSPESASFQFAVEGGHQKTMRFGIQLHTGVGSTDYSASVLPEKEEWMQVAATLAPGTKQFFVNGSMTDYTADASTPAKLETDLWIGAISPVLAENYDKEKIRYGFDGLIDEIWIFNRALSAVEIQTLYALGVSPESDNPIEKTIEEGGVPTSSEIP